MGGSGSSINTSITTVHIALLFTWYFYVVNFTVAFLLLNGSLEIMQQMSVYYWVWQQYISVRKHTPSHMCVRTLRENQISSLYRWSRNSSSEFKLAWVSHGGLENSWAHTSICEPRGLGWDLKDLLLKKYCR